jgi:hypothetical protein
LEARLARINLTLPDPLYERLERFRDRVNVSKVCALALTKELDMIEGTAAVAEDPKVQRLVNRFLQQRELTERWYRRGKQDGETWAIERATLDELRRVAESWDEDGIDELDDLDEFADDDDEYPTLRVRPALRRWTEEDRAGGTVEEPDWRAYLKGWYHGARDLWKAAAPILG